MQVSGYTAAYPVSLPTLSPPILHSLLPEQIFKKSLLLLSAAAVTLIHTYQHRLLADNLYVLPGYADILTPAAGLEKSALAPDDDGAELPAFAADFHVAYTAEAVSVFSIDNLFIPKIGNAAIHKIHLTALYAPIKNALINKCITYLGSVTGTRVLFLHFLSLLPKNFR